MTESKSVLTWSVAAVAKRLPFAAGVRRNSSLALLQRFNIGLISLFCCAQGIGAFVESDGLVVMEAEHYQNATSASTHS